MLVYLNSDSYYSYDISGRYLTSVSTPAVTLGYEYNENGDLISATDEQGSMSSINYNENSWIERIVNFDSNSEQVSSSKYETSWNGKMDITVSPMNSSSTLVHDRMGNVVSIATNNGLPEVSVELSYGRRVLLGDEVSSCKVVASLRKRKTYQ